MEMLFSTNATMYPASQLCLNLPHYECFYKMDLCADCFLWLLFFRKFTHKEEESMKFTNVVFTMYFTLCILLHVFY